MVAQTWVKSALAVAAIQACAAAGAPHAPAHTRADLGFVSSGMGGPALHQLRVATCGRSAAAGSLLALRAMSDDSKKDKKDKKDKKGKLEACETTKDLQSLGGRSTMSYLNWMAPSVPPELCDEGKVVEIKPWVRIGASTPAASKKTEVPVVKTTGKDKPKVKSRKPDGVVVVPETAKGDIGAKKAEKLAKSAKASASKDKSAKDSASKDKSAKAAPRAPGRLGSIGQAIKGAAKGAIGKIGSLGGNKE